MLKSNRSLIVFQRSMWRDYLEEMDFSGECEHSLRCCGALMKGGRQCSWAVNDVISCNEEEKWLFWLHGWNLSALVDVSLKICLICLYLFCQCLLWLCLSFKTPWSRFLQSICYLFIPSFLYLPFLPPSSAVILPGCRFPFEPVCRSRSSPETWQIDGESVLRVRGRK